VPAEVECARIVPVLEALAKRFAAVPLSVDTVHATTAEAALAAGACIVNDVTAGRHDPELLNVVARRSAGVVLSHSRGRLGHLASYDAADYGGDVTGAVLREIGDAMTAARAAGIALDAIVLDPGFGFSKTASQSLALLNQLDAVVALGRPVLVGVSRKRFLGEATGRPIEDRDRATAAACALAFDRGARLFRVHDAAAVRDALAVAEAVAGPTA
jgi:dihydropteroate synthase